MSSLLRVIRETMHFLCSPADSRRMPVGTPNSLVQACSTWANARVFSCLRAQKSLGPEVVESAKSGWGIPPAQGLMLGQGQSECCHLLMGPLEGFRVAKAFPYQVGAH